MTKILFWNVENFALNKIDDPSLAISAGHGGLADNVASLHRQQVMLSVILDTDPDIFVMVEVCTGDTGVARSLVTETGGAFGCRRLLGLLRIFQADWRLAPPIIVGSNGLQESVAVFYRGAPAGGRLRYFTGPDRWMGAATGPPGGGAGVAYVAPWDVALRPGLGAARAIPGAAGYNAGINEDRAAARVVNVVYPLGAGPFAANQRQPYMATFFETGGGAADRNIAIFAIHAPANAFGAANYLAAAGAAVVAEPGPAGVAPETRIVAGDFNLNLLDGGGALANPYGPFVGYTPLLTMPGPYAAGGATLISYTAYSTTHIKPKRIFGAQCASFMSSVAVPSYYPGFGYFGSALGGSLYSIDNLLLLPPAALPAMPPVTSVNYITGTPYVALAGLAGTVPMVAPGALVIPCYFNTQPGGYPWSGAVIGQAPAFDIGVSSELLSWNNYGRLRSTSDHLAIYADV